MQPLLRSSLHETSFIKGRTKENCMKSRALNGITFVVILGMLLAGCGGATGTKDKVSLQLKWVTQAQFAGYYAALDQGYYTAENLDVTILEGGPNIAPEQVVASNGAQFGIDWMGSLLSSRDQGVQLVNIGQVFQRGAILEVSWKDSNIQGVPDFKGKTIGVWGFGNEFDLYAALAKHNIDKEKDVTIFQ
jgi:NitT/TauT family transport system substrate-binding protein